MHSEHQCSLCILNHNLTPNLNRFLGVVGFVEQVIKIRSRIKITKNYQKKAFFRVICNEEKTEGHVRLNRKFDTYAWTGCVSLIFSDNDTLI